MEMEKFDVCVVGGGIAGLTAALFLTRKGLSVVIIGSQEELGGQINTASLLLPDGEKIIIEEGAEGYVTRSQIFPEIASVLGISDLIVKQETVTDFELLDSYELQLLKPGEAATKLGFQVKAEDKGRGVCSFRGGLGELVNVMKDFLSSKGCVFHLCEEVLSLSADGGEKLLQTKSLKIRSDKVIFAINPEIAIPIITKCYSEFSAFLPPRKFNSHISVHLVYNDISSENNDQSNAFSKSPKYCSFTICPELQIKLSGLRAVSFVNEKFPCRATPPALLFRFYFRVDPSAPLLFEEDKYVKICESLNARLFGLHKSISSKVSQWHKALPEFTSSWTDQMKQIKADIYECSQGTVFLAGSATDGAGLDVAASSGKSVSDQISTTLESI